MVYANGILCFIKYLKTSFPNIHINSIKKITLDERVQEYKNKYSRDKYQIIYMINSIGASISIFRTSLCEKSSQCLANHNNELLSNFKYEEMSIRGRVFKMPEEKDFLNGNRNTTYLQGKR